MANETKTDTIVSETTSTELKKSTQKSEKPEVSRVSRKIDLNTVEVQFGSDAKPGEFSVISDGRIHGTGTYDGKSEFQVVPLSIFLPRGGTHNFSVLFK